MRPWVEAEHLPGPLVVTPQRAMARDTDAQMASRDPEAVDAPLRLGAIRRQRDQSATTAAVAAQDDGDGTQPPRGQRPARAAAAARAIRRARRLAVGGRLELLPQPVLEIQRHSSAPILLRMAASPRLTRLRTTASDVCSDSAISS